MERTRLISLFISTVMFSSLITIGVTAIFVSSLIGSQETPSLVGGEE